MDGIHTTLFRQGDGAFGYRISTIVVLSSGRVLAFCEARRRSLSDSGSIDIVMRAGDGLSFGPVRTVVSGGDDTVGNPCPLQDPVTGRLFLLYNANDADKPEEAILCGKGPRSVLLVFSDDGGETWSGPMDITPDVKRPFWTWYAVGPCHGAALPSGRLAFGCNHAVLDPAQGRSGPYTSHILYSDDHGESWHLGPDLAPGTNECSLAPFADGGVLASMRYIPFRDGEEDPRCRALALSADGAASFSETILRRDLTDPCCQGSLLTVRTEKGEEILMSNASSVRRENLTVRRSRDRGVSWTVERVVEPGPSAYSDMAQLPDGRVALLCEAGRSSPYERIDLHVFSLR